LNFEITSVEIPVFEITLLYQLFDIFLNHSKMKRIVDDSEMIFFTATNFTSPNPSYNFTIHTFSTFFGRITSFFFIQMKQIEIKFVYH